MCWGCVREYYEEEGIKWDDDYPLSLPSPTPEHVALMQDIWDFYRLEDCGTGGPLHITLDDCNVTDGNLDFCRGRLNGVTSTWSQTGWQDHQGPPMEGDIAVLGHRILDGICAISSCAERAMVVELADPYSHVQPTTRFQG